MVSRILETPKSQEDKGGEDLETLCKEVAATLYLGEYCFSWIRPSGPPPVLRVIAHHSLITKAV